MSDVKESIKKAFSRRVKKLPEELRNTINDNIADYEKLIYKMARKYVRSRVEHADLVQEALIGLALAHRDFDPERSSDFHTYLIYRMKGRMYEYFIRNESPIYIPAHVAKAASYVKQMKKLLDRELRLQEESSLLWDIITQEEHKAEDTLSEAAREALRSKKKKLGNIASHSKMDYNSLASYAMESLSLVVSDDVLVKFPRETGMVDDIVSNKELHKQLKEALGEKKYTVLIMRTLGWNHREIAVKLAELGYTNKEGKQISRQAVKAILDETIKSVEKMKNFKDLGELFEALKYKRKEE